MLRCTPLLTLLRHVHLPPTPNTSYHREPAYNSRHSRLETDIHPSTLSLLAPDAPIRVGVAENSRVC
ncbi:hypothetical protein B0F90DRAFT_1713268, partial [Multifurca ochricompacta]